jgi:hypothetical protein
LHQFVAGGFATLLCVLPETLVAAFWPPMLALSRPRLPAIPPPPLPCIILHIHRGIARHRQLSATVEAFLVAGCSFCHRRLQLFAVVRSFRRLRLKLFSSPVEAFMVAQWLAANSVVSN